MALTHDIRSEQRKGSISDTAYAEIDGIRAELAPDELLVELRSTTQELKWQAMSLWHRVAPPHGMMVHLESQAEEMRIISLTIESDDPGWQTHWPRWSYAIRHTPELLGGTAVDAQDILSDDAATLTLLLLPGESRTALLSIQAVLDGETTPGIYTCRIHVTDMTQQAGESCTLSGKITLAHPASQLLNLLPSIYREALDRLQQTTGDQAQPFFLRFLRGFDDLQEPLERTIGVLHQCFGPYSAPSDLLPWLANWAALVLNENWPLMRRRRLIAEAVELYRWRGTRKGLSRYLEIYTGIKPEINDQPFRGWRLGQEALLGQNTVLGDVADHTFVVTLAVLDPTVINEQIVRDIIDSEKPAHTGYSLRIVRHISLEEERITQ